MNSKTKTALLMGAVAAVALSMRAPMSSVGPLIGPIQESLQLNSAVAGFLTTIPLMIFAAASPLAGKLPAMLDNRALLYGCLSLSIVGILLRAYCGMGGLFLGTILIGISIAVLNIFMPAFIRHEFGSVGFVTGVYSAAMTAASALSAGLSQPLAGLLGSWQNSLAASAVLSGIALCICAAAHRAVTARFSAACEAGAARAALVTPKNIAIGVFMGLQSFLFFSVIAWYPSIMAEQCPQIQSTGMLVLVLQISGLAPTLLFPMLCQRIQRKDIFAACSVMIFVSGVILVIVGGAFVPLVLSGTVLMGIGNGATMSLALTFIALQGTSGGETARISAFIQTISYAIATFGPTGLGFLYDAFSSWRPILWTILLFSVLLLSAGFLAGRLESGTVPSAKRQS